MSQAKADVQQTQRPDRRVLRTREALRDALLAMMAERGWDAIDVQALCERANVGRSTFYLHYASKEALLDGGFDGLRAALREHAQHASKGASAPGEWALVRGLIAHVHQEQRVFRAMLGRRSGQFVQDRFRELLVNLVDEELSLPNKRSWRADAAAHCLAGALFQLLTWWLGTNKPHSPKEIEALYVALSQPVVQAARQLK